MRKPILRESELRYMINESVKRALNERYWSDMDYEDEDYNEYNERTDDSKEIEIKGIPHEFFKEGSEGYEEGYDSICGELHYTEEIISGMRSNDYDVPDDPDESELQDYYFEMHPSDEESLKPEAIDKINQFVEDNAEDMIYSDNYTFYLK